MPPARMLRLGEERACSSHFLMRLKDCGRWGGREVTDWPGGRAQQQGPQHAHPSTSVPEGPKFWHGGMGRGPSQGPAEARQKPGQTSMRVCVCVCVDHNYTYRNTTHTRVYTWAWPRVFMLKHLCMGTPVLHTHMYECRRHPSVYIRTHVNTHMHMCSVSCMWVCLLGR